MFQGCKKSFILISFVIILNSVAFVNITPFYPNSIIEAFLLLLGSLLLVIQIATKTVLTTIKLSELIFLLLLLFVQFKNTLANTFEVTSISYLLFFSIFYYTLRLFFTANSFSTQSGTLFLSTVIIFIAYLFFAVYHCFVVKEKFDNFFIPNKSTFSILLASQIAFILPLYFFYKRETTVIISFLVIFIITASILLLGLTKGRAGWIGFMLAIIYIASCYFSGIRSKKTILYFAFLLFVFISFFLFGYKPESSEGRMLIHKVSLGILKDNWLWGIGHGQFKIRYNEYQAAYFSTHNIDSKEALLANNSFYAFNDFLQVFIENGIPAFILLVVILLVMIGQIKNVIVGSHNKHLFTAAVASLICIATGALFSYPLQIFPVLFQLTLCLSIINSFPSNNQLKIELEKKWVIRIKTIMALTAILLFTHFCFYFNYKIKCHQVFELIQTGLKQKAINKYEGLEDSYVREGNSLYQYAQQLYYKNELQKAAQIISKAKLFYCTHEVYKLSAAIENELQHFDQAEKDYKTAIYMVPNRMLSRNDLLEYYLERKDTANIIYWANSIIQMPVKVPSTITRNIQQKAREILMPLSR